MGHALSTTACQVTLAGDVGPESGLGHMARMRALARALTACGLTCQLTDASQGASNSIVVVDSYQWRADDPGRFSGDLIVAVEDLGRDQAVALLVDFFAPPAPKYVRPRRVLAGPAYVLLDMALTELETPPIVNDVARVIVAGGGGIDSGWAAGVARRLRSALEPPTRVALVQGPWSAHPPPPGVDSIRTTEGLGPELAIADLVVTAAGVTMLEALALGRPTVASILADNQGRQGHAAHKAGAVVLVDPDGAAAAAALLASDAGRRQALASAATHLVDGLGARRVAEAICGLA